MNQPPPSDDEHRVRRHLRALGARPVGHAQETTTMSSEPVTPIRIIPAGAPLPARPPEPGETPLWHTAPPPPSAVPASSPPPTEVVVHVIHDAAIPPAPPPPAPLWARAWDWLARWRVITALATALVPWWAGTSPVSAWAHTLHQARTEAGTGAAYVIAGAALAAAWALDKHTNRWIPRVLLTTALIGSLGAMAWFDPITALTGVHA